MGVFIIIASSRSISYPFKLVLGFAVLVEMYLNGSRTGLVAVISAMGIFVLASMSINNPGRLLRISGMLALVSVACITLGVVYKDKLLEQVSQSRVSELVDFASTSKLDDVGSMSDRLDLWDRVAIKVDKFDMFDQMFGRGLTSGVEVASGLGIHNASVSANRIFHNEYLRIYYELGIVGLLIFVSFVAVIILFSWKVKKRAKNVALLSFLPGFFAFLSVENILSASGNAGGIGILLVFSYSTYLYEQAKRNQGKNLVDKKLYANESRYKAA
ncbi:MAG: O-antigen ligase family protein [Gammaproteobacteria bacterium]|nr:O-antigen ligase family protein [Gammaproteobacteria bacterium]